MATADVGIGKTAKKSTDAVWMEVLNEIHQSDLWRKKQMKRMLLVLIMLTSVANSKIVLVSFDGSGYLDVWKDTLDFAKQEDIKCTYFVSAPYFITESEVVNNPYWAVKEIGEPLIKMRRDGWQYGLDKRWAFLNRAQEEGHDISSHLCGHYDGSKWTYEQWMKEIKFFKFAMRKFNHPILGIRAPHLGVNAAYFEAIKDSGYLYDSSQVYRKSGKYGFAKEIPIRQIEIKGATKLRATLPFDCNFIILKEAKALDMEKVFFDSLCSDYLNSPLPTQVCLHFEKVPGAPYMNAMKRFVKWAKERDAKFMTYGQYYETEMN